MWCWQGFLWHRSVPVPFGVGAAASACPTRIFFMLIPKHCHGEGRWKGESLRLFMWVTSNAPIASVSVSLSKPSSQHIHQVRSMRSELSPWIEELILVIKCAGVEQKGQQEGSYSNKASQLSPSPNECPWGQNLYVMKHFLFRVFVYITWLKSWMDE